MSSRRKFIKNTLSIGGLAVIPSLGFAEESGSLVSLIQQPQQTDADYWKSIRLQFPLKEGQTYFNNGTMGPVPNYTLNRVIDNMRYNAIHGAETDYKGEGPQLLTGYFKYEDIRRKVGRVINCQYDEIALTQNATFGMNYVANGLDLKKGDELINTDQEHGGGFAAWQLLAKRRGCVYKQAKIDIPANDPKAIIDSIFSQVTKKTKVIAVPHMFSVYGVILPVKEICDKAKALGIFTILDGAQTVGQIPVDVKDIGCDAYYSSFHKWMLAPGGNGILYIDKSRMPEIWSTIASYNWNFEEDHGFRLMQNGTGNTSVLEGLNASIDFYNSIGPEKWLNRIKHLGDYLRTGLQGIDRVTIGSSIHKDMCAGITTYAVEGLTGPELQKKLWEKEKLQPRSVGKDWLRHSVHIYNNEEEIDRALKVIRAV